MTSAARSGQGIPRLQELGFVLRAGKDVARGGTFEQIRRGLIDEMSGRARENTPSGNSAVHRIAEEKPGFYVNNASEALVELMRAGFVERTPVPSSPKAAGAYVHTRFLLTDEGVAWVELLEKEGEPAALDALLKRLWTIHPQLAGYIRLLSPGGTLVIPTVTWSSVHAETTGSEGRDKYIDALVERVMSAMRSGRAGWQADADEVRQAIAAYVARRQAYADKRGRPPYKRAGDFVSDCDQAVTVLALGKAGVGVDYISFEILRRWTQDLLIANFSYWVPAGEATAMRAWGTATLEEHHGVPRFVRRPPSSERTHQIEELLPEAFRRVRSEHADSSFVPIWKVRAYVCSELRVNDVVFDSALREFQRRARRGELPFQISLEVSTSGSIPPTERPLRGIPDRHGREVLFSLVNVSARRRERTTT
jgi:hypothetical protein